MQVNEIFTSLSGEPDGWNNKGGLTTFIRLQGCNLRCIYCDTPQALQCSEGKGMTIAEIVTQCDTYHVVITGGEPLLQKDCGDLIEAVIRTGRLVTVETNGTLKLPFQAPELRYVVDYKLNCELRLEALYAELYSTDVIKFVLCNMVEYLGVVKLIRNPYWHAKRVFSPAQITQHHDVWPKALAQQMIEDHIEAVTLSTQLHKELNLR